MDVLFTSHTERTYEHFLEKWLIPDLGQKMYRMNLPRIIIPENKGAIKV